MKNILVALDFASPNKKILDQAERLARAFHAKLCLVHVVAPDPDFVGYEAGPQEVRDQVAHERRQEHRELQQIGEQLGERGISTATRLVQGPTVETLLSIATEVKADMIVIGGHRHGWLYKLVLGSTTEALIDRAARPVLVVPVDQ
jgi:nucleotide-binding universal stress UspA family protein